MSTCDSKGCGGNSSRPTPAQQREMKADADLGSTLAIYRIDNMDCPTEEALIRSKLTGMQGVAKLDFNLMQRTLSVHHELPSLAPVEQALAAVGMQAVRTRIGRSAKCACRTQDH